MRYTEDIADRNTYSSDDGRGARTAKPKEQPEGEGDEQGIEERDRRKASETMQQAHDDFRQPFMGNPWSKMARVGKNIPCQDRLLLQHDFPGLDMPEGIRVIQHLAVANQQQGDKNDQREKPADIR